MNIDIATTVKVILALIALGVFAAVYYGIASIRTASKLEFFQKKQNLIAYGWRLMFLALLLLGVWFWVFRKAEPIAYQYFPPSPTYTRTPTITLTPTITPTLKETLTPTVTETLQYTYTPVLPAEAQATIQTPVGPDTSAIFSELFFSTKLDATLMLTDVKSAFQVPVTHVYGGFTFDKMSLGVQWTAVWLYEGEIFYIESKVWTNKDGSGGYGYTDCQQEAEKWLPGNYEVQIYVGSTWKASGRFTIVGNETATPTPTSTGVIADTTLAPTASLTPAP
jgi:hypothetical protein